MIFVSDIKAVVAHAYGVPSSVMDEPDSIGARVNARPRQMAMALADGLTSHGPTKIGRLFHRDHSTVLHAIRQVKADPLRRATMRVLKKRLEAGL